MRGRHRLLIWILLTILVSVTCRNKTSVAKTTKPAKSGPYRSVVVRLEQCAKPSRPYIQTLIPFVFQVELYNTSTKFNLMRGNITIMRETKNVKMRFKGYYYENNKWQLRYFFNNIGCNGVIIKAMLNIMGFKYNEETCAVPKGSFHFENVDWDVIEHTLWANKREYGRLKWISESYLRSGVISCWEIENVIIPTSNAIH